MRRYRRHSHQLVSRILRALDADALLSAKCYFGGGTQLALTYGEYRESKDIDFLCSSRAGFRTLREGVTQESLGAILREPVHLAREVRADRDGIRTFFLIDDLRIKFEILLEARIDLVREKRLAVSGWRLAVSQSGAIKRRLPTIFARGLKGVG